MRDFRSRAEWDAAMDQAMRVHRAEFLQKVMRYIRGEQDLFVAGSL
jgi:hypothetical protein